MPLASVSGRCVAEQYATYREMLHTVADVSSSTAGTATALARARFLAGERVDMNGLAADLGLHRTTLFRAVGGRDRLLGEVLWSLAEPALRAAERGTGTGAARI